jgi:hypothetical protein
MATVEQAKQPREISGKGLDRSTVLFVTKEDTPTADERAFQTRLEELVARLEFVLLSRSWQTVREQDLANTMLVVVCAPSVTRWFRTLGVPILVCSPEVLYDFGMTAASEGVDYGWHGETAFVEVAASDHQLSAGLSGQVRISQEPQRVRWGKPNSSAIIGATIPGNRDKAVVFGYAQGDGMPALAAPHRRVAFLLGHPTQLTPDGRGLLDAALGWALTGGGPPSKTTDAKGGFWFIEGQPTKVLSVEEYRSWVEDRVSTAILAKLFKWTPLILFFVSAIVLSALQWMISIERNKLEDDVRKSVQNSVANQAEAAVGKILVNNTGLVDKLKEESKDTWRKVEDRLTEKTIDTVREKFSNEKELVAPIETVLMGRMIERTLTTFENDKEDLHKRVLALQRLELVETGDTLSPRLRMALLKVFDRADTDEVALLSAALRAYKPARNDVQAVNSLLNLVTGVESYLYAGMNDPTRVVEVLDFARAFSDCLARCKEENANQLATWLEERVRSSDSAKKLPSGFEIDKESLVLGALVRMKGDEPILALVNLAEKVDDKVSHVGVKGLSRIEPQREMNPKTRDRVLRLLWDRAAVRNTEPRPNAEELRRAFVRFLRPTDPGDWEKNEIYQRAFQEILDDKLLDFVFRAWSERLALERVDRSDEQRLSDELLRQVWSVSNPLQHQGTAEALAFALQKCDEASVSKFLEQVPTLYDQVRDQSPTIGASRRALEAAIHRDSERSRSRFESAKKLLATLSGPDRKWSSTRYLAESLSQHAKEGEVRQWLYGTVNDSLKDLPDTASDLAKAAALSSLRVLRSVDLSTAMEVSERLLSYLELVKDSSPDNRKREVAREIVSTLAYHFTRNTDAATRQKLREKVHDVIKQLPTKETILVRGLLYVFLAERGDLRVYQLVSQDDLAVIPTTTNALFALAKKVEGAEHGIKLPALSVLQKQSPEDCAKEWKRIADALKKLPAADQSALQDKVFATIR